MIRDYAVYTVDAECQDCYKCLRLCPAKAIKVIDGKAEIIAERCVACGHCINTCPVGAKHIRSDLSRVSSLLASNRETYAVVAPSWRAEFPELSEEELIDELMQLGFLGVAEAAAGAQVVSAAVTELLLSKPQIWISSACPACVDFVLKYYPEFRDNITPLASPAETTANMLKAKFGEDIQVVFIGPCAAKKNESDARPELVKMAITFHELHGMLEHKNAPQAKNSRLLTEESFVLTAAEEGVMYPAEGGMIKTIEHNYPGNPPAMLAISGLGRLGDLLDSLKSNAVKSPIFIETLSCRGGCLGGPGMDKNLSLAAISESLTQKLPDQRRDASAAVQVKFPAAGFPLEEYSEEELRGTLLRFGKTKLEDELNCGGCGYSTCRQLAEALLAGRAEPAMCVSFMRLQAQNKANALLRSMPSGVVIVDSNMTIVECNFSFAKIFCDDAEMIFETAPGLHGAKLNRMIDFADLFSTALRTGCDIQRSNLSSGDKMLDVSVFVIEMEQTVGAVIHDVTKEELQRDEIARRARGLIQKNISTVQEIACLLGEYVSDTEIILSSIADGCSDDDLAEKLTGETFEG